jgi:hypothetical protein
MPEFRPSNDPPPLDLAARRHCIRDKVLVGLVLFTLVRTGEALAGDQASIGNAALNPEVGDLRRSSPPAPALITTPELFAPAAGDSQAFSTTEFRPRKHSVLDADPVANSFGDAPMLRGTTVWQRLSEYRAHDRVRVLTLWESGGSTVSLQAGKHGSPSLQWTSGAMIHGAATRGLLDRLFAVSLAGAGNRLRHPDRPASAPAPPNQGNVPVVAASVK